MTLLELQDILGEKIRIANDSTLPRKINTVMNCNSWFTTNRENTLTAIKWCELFYALKEADT